MTRMFEPATDNTAENTAEPVAPSVETDARTYCAVHPTIETTLRCNKCGRYMCTKCAVRTPVGYRCRQCVNQQQDVFFTATQTDYLITAGVSFGLGIPAAFLTRFGLFLVIILSLVAGGLIAEAVIRATGKRRGRYTWMVAVGGIALSALVICAPELLPLLTLLGPRGGLGAAGVDLMFYVLPIGLYIVMCAGAAAARLRYGK